jgi:hypothetical protein
MISCMVVPINQDKPDSGALMSIWIAALRMPRNGSLTEHKGTSRGDQGGQLGRNHGCHDKDNDDQDDDHEDLRINVRKGVSVRCQRDRHLPKTYIVKTSDSPIKIPHRSL